MHTFVTFIGLTGHAVYTCGYDNTRMQFEYGLAIYVDVHLDLHVHAKCCLTKASWTLAPQSAAY